MFQYPTNKLITFENSPHYMSLKLNNYIAQIYKDLQLLLVKTLRKYNFRGLTTVQMHFLRTAL